MIALFDEPIRVSIDPKWSGGRVGLLAGVALVGGDLEGIVVLEDGSVSLIGVKYFTMDWRYDVQQDRWLSLDAMETAQG